MKVLKIIGFVILCLIVIILILGLIAPRKYAFEKTTTIQASPEIVFYEIQYWSNWNNWSPWAGMDSTMQVTIQGEDGTVGSTYHWEGEKTGVGDITSTAIRANEAFEYHLTFLKPWKSESEGYLRLKQDGDTTEVAWGMYGSMGYPFNVMMLFSPMEKMMEKDFNRGLELLKGAAEARMQAVKKFTIEEKMFPPVTYVVIRDTVRFSEMPNFFASSYGSLAGALAKAGKSPAGQPAAIYFSWDMEKSQTDVAAGLPIQGTAPAGFTTVRLPWRMSLQGDFFGPYAETATAHWAFDQYLSRYKLEMVPPMLEIYMNDPAAVADPSEIQTRIVYFVR